MLRVLLVALGLAVFAPGPAAAVLVYERPSPRATAPRNGEIVVARNDGSHARVVARGNRPLLSPDGRQVGYLVEDKRAHDSLRIVASGGGTSHRLLQRVFDQSTSERYAPFVWSPNSRQVLADSGHTVLIDVHRRTARRLPLAGAFFSASFSPDGKSAAISGEGTSADVVYALNLRTGHRRRVASVSYYEPVWGKGGIALAWQRGGQPGMPVAYDLALATKPGRSPQLLASDAYPIAWDRSGHRVLASTPAAGGVQAALVDATTRNVVRLPSTLSMVESLSRDSSLVLGEAGGNVVAEAADGTLTTLAAGATHPSWTR